ncbi:MAG: alpha/beta hydrolase [Frankiales bacterium]|nr:alpha/beta hydrolase [Frankiales bacterium]
MGRHLPAPERRHTDGPAGQLSYLVWGAAGPEHPEQPGQPLVLLHPVNSAAAVWHDAASLIALDRPTYAIDYRGHGRSAAGGPYLPVDYAADALAMMEAEAITAAHVAGGSIGGAVSVELAALAPGRVLSIALFGATVHLGVPDAQMAEMAAGLRELGVREWFAQHGADIIGWASVAGPVERLAELASDGREVDTVIEIIHNTFQLADSRATAAAVAASQSVPALIVAGSEDPTCPPAMARALATYFGTSAVILDGIGHLPMIEAPRLTAALLHGFLAPEFGQSFSETDDQ